MLYVCVCKNEYFLTKGDPDTEKTDYYGTCEKCGDGVTRFVYRNGKVETRHHSRAKVKPDNQERPEKEQ